MKPLVIYNTESLPWIQRLLALGARLDLKEVGDPTITEDGRIVAYFRIPGMSIDALRKAKTLAIHGTEIVNHPSIALKTTSRSDCYDALRRAGFRVPWSMTAPTLDQIYFALEAGFLSYPFLIRTQEGMNGQGMDMIRGESQLVPALKRYQSAGWRYMVCEYINTKRDGMYWKWRPCVFNGAVDMWEAGCANVWIVNLAHNQDVNVPAFKAANEESNWPRKWDAMVASVGAVFGLGIYALDLAVDPKKPDEPVITDVNSTYGMTADLLPMDLFSPAIKAVRDAHYSRLAGWLETFE